MQGLWEKGEGPHRVRELGRMSMTESCLHAVQWCACRAVGIGRGPHRVRQLGRMSMEKSCLPVHNSRGFTSAGCGRSTASMPSPMKQANCDTCARL